MKFFSIREKEKFLIKRTLLFFTSDRQNDTYDLDMFSADNSIRRCFSCLISSKLDVAQVVISFEFREHIKDLWESVVRGIPKMQFDKDKICLLCEKEKKPSLPSSQSLLLPLENHFISFR